MKLFNFFKEKKKCEELAHDFSLRVREIREINSERICKKLAQYEIDACLYEQGYLMPYHQALGIAVAKFIQAKKDGKIDELNNIKEATL